MRGNRGRFRVSRAAKISDFRVLKTVSFLHRHLILMNHYVLSIGANLGQRHRQLVEGLRALQQGGVEILRWSRLFETAPVGVLDQPHFLNAAVWCRSVHNPLALLGLLKRIEYEEAGRDPQVRAQQTTEHTLVRALTYCTHLLVCS